MSLLFGHSFWQYGRHSFASLQMYGFLCYSGARHASADASMTRHTTATLRGPACAISSESPSARNTSTCSHKNASGLAGDKVAPSSALRDHLVSRCARPTVKLEGLYADACLAKHIHKEHTIKPLCIPCLVTRAFTVCGVRVFSCLMTNSRGRNAGQTYTTILDNPWNMRRENIQARPTGRSSSQATAKLQAAARKLEGRPRGLFHFSPHAWPSRLLFSI